MSLPKDLDRANARIADLEAMLDTLSGRYDNSEFKWEAWDFRANEGHTRTINLPSSGRLYIELGKDRYGRMMRLQVAPSRGPDGTRGVEIRGEIGLLRSMSSAANVLYVTEQDPRDVSRDVIEKRKGADD